jgi:pimeloyl-ACP methyl ester carboxylesterase
VTSAEPYRDAATHLRDEIRRAWLRVEYEIRLGWTRNQGAAGPAGDAVSPTEIGRLFATARGEPSGDEAGAKAVLAQWLELHRTVEARLAASLAAGVRSPLVDLMRVFGLTPRQWSTLMFALLPDADPNLVLAYRYLARDPSGRGLDGRLLAQLVYDTPETRSLMARDLSNSSPLVRYQLIDLAPGDSLLFRRIRAASRLVHLLDGTSIELDPELAELAELRGRGPAGEFPTVAVELATAALRSSEVVLAVQGQRGLGKKLLLQRAATHWNQRLLVIDGKRLAAMQPLAQAVAIRSLVRELILLDAVPVVADIDDVVVRDGDRDELPGFFGTLLASWSGPIAITVNRERMPRIHHRPLVHLTLEVLWIRGADDVIVSDTSLFDLGYLGQLGAVPGWPGAELYPPQPMLAQTRAMLERYAARGGNYREHVLADTGHSPHVERPAEFQQRVFAFLRACIA